MSVYPAETKLIPPANIGSVCSQNLQEHTNYSVADLQTYYCPPLNTPKACNPFSQYVSYERDCVCYNDYIISNSTVVTLWQDEASCGGEHTYYLKAQNKVLREDEVVPGTDNADNI